MANVEIKTLLSANIAQMMSAFNTVEGKADSLSSGALKNLKSSIERAFGAAAIIAFAKESVSAAAAFDDSMRNVNSIAMQTEDQFKETRDSVLLLSAELGKSPDDLAKALYDINSAGFNASEGLEVLRASTIAAQAGVSNTNAAAKAITGTLNAYGLSSEYAADVSDILFATVKDGVVNFEQLSGGLGKVNSTAASAGLQFDDVGAALAAMTKNGMEADQSFTSLNQLILSFLKPSEELNNLFIKQAGVMPSVILKTKGLSGALEILKTATNGDAEATTNFIKESNALKAALSLTGKGADNYNASLKNIGDEIARQGATNDAYTENMKGQGKQWDALKVKIEAASIVLGDYIGKTILHAISGFEDFSAALGHLSTGDMSGFVDALTTANYAQQLMTESLKKSEKQIVSTTESVVDAGKKISDIDVSPQVDSTGTDDLAKSIENIKKKVDEVSGRDIDINLPHITEKQVEIYKMLFTEMENFSKADISIDVNITHLTKSQVELWGKFFDLVRYTQVALSVNIQLEHLTNQQLVLYEKFFSLLANAKSIEINIPKIEKSDIANYKEFFNNLSKAGVIKLDFVLSGDMKSMASDIAAIKDKITSLEGVIFA